MALDGSSTSPLVMPYHTAGDYYPRKLGPKPDVVPSGVTERKVGPLDKPDMMVSVDIINIKEPGRAAFGASSLAPARVAFLS
ncbi:hypothetical protein Z043_126239 [Scleropages formosus]|uniref:Uncharacterized protein n=1 Tax=Scleropages formosus TaxID=113540 RepID=A0A0P7U903_SCLFO|nr:hypothetical protein Z043_126239 [Scleropages formosus]